MAERPLYLIAVCEGRDCVPFSAFGDAPLMEAEAVAFLALLSGRRQAPCAPSPSRGRCGGHERRLP